MVPISRRILNPGRVGSTVLVGAGSGWLLSSLLAHGGVPWSLGPVADITSVVATALFFGAGVLRYSRWTLTGEASFAVNGSALVVFAAIAFPMALASRALSTEPNPPGWSSLARLVTAVTVTAMLSSTLWSPQVDSNLRPRLRAIIGVSVSTTVFTALVLAHRIWEAFLGGSQGVSGDLELTVAGIWLVAAWGFAALGRRNGSPTTLWSAASLALLGMAGLLRSGAAATGSTGWLIGAAYLTAVAAVVSLLNAGADLNETMASEGEELRSTSGALADAEVLLGSAERRRQEVVHDSRSMIAALRTASRALDHYENTLDDDTRQRLQAAMDDELVRLGRLIDTQDGQPVVEFGLDEALLPIIATQRADGLAVDADLGGLRACGRPDDLAEALQNVLVNARRHAPGSRVTVRAETVARHVRVYVEDRGPGVAPERREAIFGRGERATTSEGSGLGLFVVRRLLAEQQGGAEVVERPGGGARFVLWLPASPVHADPAMSASGRSGQAGERRDSASGHRHSHA
jgi:signal transduction histidine kinase